MRSMPSKTILSALLLAALGATGCRRDEVSHVSLPASPAAAPARVSPTAAATAQMNQGGADLAPASNAGSLKWALPKGWEESHPGGMRYATLTPKGGGVDVSVIVLPGQAGGELPNVNRWRGQIGLPPIDEAALSSARQTVKSKAFPISVFDFTGEGEKKSRMVSALATTGGNTWFVKMVGDATQVGAAKPEFLHLLQSLHFDAAN